MTPSNPMSLEQVRDVLLKGFFRVPDGDKLCVELADAIDAAIKRRESEARDRVAIALREPNSAKAAQVASSLGASPPSQPSTGVPDGWQLVPVDPTVTMVEAVINCIYSHAYSSEEAYARAIYSAAISAAPRSP